MRDLLVWTLFSGSSGNCVYVKTPDISLLIDAGVSARAVETGLSTVGASLAEIGAIFVTHEHVDHVRGLEVISKNHHIPVHMTEPSARALIHDPCCSLLGDLYLHPLVYAVRYGDTTVRSFLTCHDSAASVGYTVEYAAGGATEKIGVVTDLGHVEDSVLDALTGAEAAIVEANHDEEMLLTGPYPYALKRRILSDRGHLSNDAAGKLARALADGGTKRFLLAHLSKENNHPAVAKAAVEAALADVSGVSLDVALPDCPVKL